MALPQVRFAYPTPKGSPLSRTEGGGYVRRRLGANLLQATFVENIIRPWESHFLACPTEPRLSSQPTPSIATWARPATDPGVLVRRALDF